MSEESLLPDALELQDIRSRAELRGNVALVEAVDRMLEELSHVDAEQAVSPCHALAGKALRAADQGITCREWLKRITRHHLENNLPCEPLEATIGRVVELGLWPWKEL